MVEPAAKKSTTSMSGSSMRKKKPEKERLAAEKQQQNSGSSSSKKQSSSGTAGAEPAASAAESPSYRLALRSLFSCRNTHAQHHTHRVPPAADSGAVVAMASKKCKKQQQQQLGCSSGASICKLRDAGPRRPVLMKKPEEEPPNLVDAMTTKRRASVSGGGGGSGGERRAVKKALQQRQGEAVAVVVSSSSSSSSAAGGSFRLRRLSGCYECHHMVVDPMSGGGGGGSMRAAVFSCPDCGDVFVRAESLHRHQSTRHAVSELGPEDTSRNIIEIIFQSSWLKKQSPVCAVDRILKVHNAPATLARFEAHRDAVKAKALMISSSGSGSGGGGGARCTADGNELLRFHCAALACSLGLRGATHLCDHASCAACAIVRDGFVVAPGAGAGVRTMATSGRAHDAVAVEYEDGGERRRAMLVCRVIAGRVKRPAQEKEAAAPESEKKDDLPPEMETKTAEEEEDEYDSVAGSAGVYSSMDELEVFNPTAILPCFVVVYKA